jgi:hypothetical protein
MGNSIILSIRIYKSYRAWYWLCSQLCAAENIASSYFYMQSITSLEINSLSLNSIHIRRALFGFSYMRRRITLFYLDFLGYIDHIKMINEFLSPRVNLQLGF